MSPLRLVGVCFAYRPDVPLLDDVTLHLDGGWTAIVGPNGAGKTTLLRLLAGELAPQRGTRSGPAAVVCPQRVDPPDDALRAFAWGWTGDDAWALQQALGLDPAALARWDTLSWGERKRWQIGAALGAHPAALLLDEPTNHLDADGRDQLIAALRQFAGVGVVVSHDRALLGAVATAVVRLERGRTSLFPGGWDAAVAQRALDQAAAAQRLDAASGEARAARRQLQAERQRHAASQGGLSVRRRVTGPRDADGRSMARKARAERAEARIGRGVEVARRRAEAAAEARAGLDAPRALGGDLSFPAAACPRRRLLAWRGTLRMGDRALAADLTLDRGERVWIRGPNGAGKSTLLRALLDAADLPEPHVLVLPQELPAGDGVEALDVLGALPPEARGRVLQAVALLGVDPGALLRSASPSPGEARKLRIALGLGQGAWLLALDEPTNHLDLPSIERLERALVGFGGAVLLVTHDEGLGRAVGQRVWTVDGDLAVG